MRLFVIGPKSGTTFCPDFWPFSTNGTAGQNSFVPFVPTTRKPAFYWENPCPATAGGETMSRRRQRSGRDRLYPYKGWEVVPTEFRFGIWFRRTL